MVTAAALAPIIGGIVGTGVGLAIATIVVNLAIAAILGKLLEPDIPQSGRDTKALQNTIRSNVAPRRVAYGESVTGGPYAVLETIGAQNEILNMVIVLTGHPIEDIIGVFIDDEYVNIAGNTNGTTNDDTNDLDTNYWVDTGKFGTGAAAAHVRIIKNLGWGFADFQYVTDETATIPTNDRERGALISTALNSIWSQPAATRDSGTGLYASGYKLTNCAHIFLSFKFNPDVWSGFPKVKFHIKGKKLYNPYLDSSLVTEGADSTGTHDLTDPDTWEYTENWSLTCLDYLLNTSYGLAARTTGILTEVNWEASIEAYLDSSELVSNGLVSPNSDTVERYTTNGIFEVSATPISIMESLLNSGLGQLIYAQGEYLLKAGVYKAPNSPNDIINEDMIISPLTIQTHTPRSEVFNKAAGVFVDVGYNRNFVPSNTNKPLFEPSDFAIVDPLDSSGQNPFEVDDGEEIIKELDYPFTINEHEAQRLSRIQLERVRQGLTASFEANLKILQYSVGDTVYLEILNNSKYSNEAFFNRLGFDDTVQDRPDSPFTPYYKQFKIVDMQYTERFTIAVIMVEESEEIYDWNEGDANLTDHELVSGMIFDNPTDAILTPSFIVASPTPTIDEVISWPNISLYIRWTAPDRGSVVNALDRAQIRSYALEYGIVTNPSATGAARVTDWVQGGSFLVADSSLDIQGPISLENLFIDEVTDFDFRLRAVLYNGRTSNWVYYEDEIGADYSPTAPPSTEVSTPIAGQKTIIYDTQITQNPFTPGLAAGEFAVSTLTNDYTPADYADIYNIFLHSEDTSNKEHNRFFNALRIGDSITMYLSAKRWYKYRLIDNTVKNVQYAANTSPNTGAIIQIKFLELIDYKDSDPTNVTAITSNVEFRFERDATVDTISELLDLKIDDTLIFGGANSNIRWNTSLVTSPNILEIQTSSGEDGTGAIYWNQTPPGAGSTTITVRSSFGFRNPGIDTKVSIRYQSISGIELTNPFRVRYQYSTYPFYQTGIDGTNKLLDFPTTGTGNWSTLTFIIPKEQGSFLGIILEAVTVTADSAFDLLIDSINIEPATLSYGFDAILSSDIATLVYEQTPYHIVDMNPATGTVTINLVSDLNTGESATMYVKTIQDATSARTITWQGNGVGGNILWAGGTTPTPSAAANAEDLYTFTTVDGTNLIGSVILNVQ